MSKSTLAKQLHGVENRLSNFSVLMNLFMVAHVDQKSLETLEEELCDIRMTLEVLRLRLSCVKEGRL